MMSTIKRHFFKTIIELNFAESYYMKPNYVYNNCFYFLLSDSNYSSHLVPDSKGFSFIDYFKLNGFYQTCIVMMVSLINH